MKKTFIILSAIIIISIICFIFFIHPKSPGPSVIQNPDPSGISTIIGKMSPSKGGVVVSGVYRKRWRRVAAQKRKHDSLLS